MYKIVEKEKKVKKVKKVTPYYLVTFSYMIGDGDADTNEESEFYEDEFDEVIQNAVHVLEEFSKIDMRKYSKYFSNYLDLEHLKIILENKLMSEEERNILSMIILSRGNGEYEDLDAIWSEDDIPSTMTREVFEKYNNLWDDFNLIEEGDLGYYSLQGVNVEYVDENGVKHEVDWED